MSGRRNLGQTLSTPSVGRFLPDASFIAKDHVAAQGLVVTTEISRRGVAHVAQVAVDPRAPVVRALLVAWSWPLGAAAATQDCQARDAHRV
jgi:hypothetical protein